MGRARAARAERRQVLSTDVYSFALVMMFMLAGRAMFDTKDVRATFPSASSATGSSREDSPRRHRATAGLPPILRALSARTVERTANVVTFVNELKEALSTMGAFPERGFRKRMPSESTETLSTPLATRQHGNAQVVQLMNEEPPAPREVPLASGTRARKSSRSMIASTSPYRASSASTRACASCSFPRATASA